MIDLRIIDHLSAVDIDRLSDETLHQFVATLGIVHAALVDELRRKYLPGAGQSPARRSRDANATEAIRASELRGVPEAQFFQL